MYPDLNEDQICGLSVALSVWYEITAFQKVHISFERCSVASRTLLPQSQSQRFKLCYALWAVGVKVTQFHCHFDRQLLSKWSVLSRSKWCPITCQSHSFLRIGKKRVHYESLAAGREHGDFPSKCLYLWTVNYLCRDIHYYQVLSDCHCW